jgi:hypothetical protein
MTQCDHVRRVSLHSSVKIGGFSMGRCEREAIDGMVVCAEHATKDALAMRIRELVKQVTRLEAA